MAVALAMCLGSRLAHILPSLGRCMVFVLSWGSGLLSAGPACRPVPCSAPAVGLAGLTHSFASLKPQEVASIKKKKKCEQAVSFRPSEQIIGALSPKIDHSVLNCQASGGSSTHFA